jgi:hypothetical protein
VYLKNAMKKMEDSKKIISHSFPFQPRDADLNENIGISEIIRKEKRRIRE